MHSELMGLLYDLENQLGTDSDLRQIMGAAKYADLAGRLREAIDKEEARDRAFPVLAHLTDVQRRQALVDVQTLLYREDGELHADKEWDGDLLDMLGEWAQTYGLAPPPAPPCDHHVVAVSTTDRIDGSIWLVGKCTRCGLEGEAQVEADQFDWSSSKED